MRLRKQNSSAEAQGFTLAEAVLALALLAIALVSLLAVRSHAVAGSRRTLLLRSAQRLAFDLAGQIEAGVFDEPEIGRVEYGIYIDNRERYRRPGNYNVPRIEYPAYPENEDEPSYPPGLKFEWEITDDGQPAEVIPNNQALANEDMKERYEQRWNRADEREREMSNRDPGAGLNTSSSSSSSSNTENDPLAEEEEEELTEQWRTLTIFVRADTTSKSDEVLFELEQRFLWTYPDRIPQLEDATDGSGGANGSNGSGLPSGNSGNTGVAK